ncbi:hypothetical protein E2562_028585 [Oryza meyeriana var. granulata]|uniref:EF-hand domain-containing protein n=1 Tax=Oryza meyeriana var. granulata TaxID=110450 RepID=A0A6G1D7S6_9ORYZ|nr:hypothetical protein E2562_028585 [Oryza meyeriana var. granulata]
MSRSGLKSEFGTSPSHQCCLCIRLVEPLGGHGPRRPVSERQLLRRLKNFGNTCYCNSVLQSSAASEGEVMAMAGATLGCHRSQGDGDGDGRVTSADGTKFFAMSILSRANFKQVWAITDQAAGFLDFVEFVTTMQDCFLFASTFIRYSTLQVQMPPTNSWYSSKSAKKHKKKIEKMFRVDKVWIMGEI